MICFEFVRSQAKRPRIFYDCSIDLSIRFSILFFRQLLHNWFVIVFVRMRETHAPCTPRVHFYQPFSGFFCGFLGWQGSGALVLAISNRGFQGARWVQADGERPRGFVVGGDNHPRLPRGLSHFRTLESPYSGC